MCGRPGCRLNSRKEEPKEEGKTRYLTTISTDDIGYIFIKLGIPKMNGYPILNITPTGNWQMIEEDVYQYMVDGFSKALESGMTTPEMIAEARFYDFDEIEDFYGELVVTAYAIQTDGFDGSQPAEIWSAAVQAEGE